MQGLFYGVNKTTGPCDVHITFRGDVYTVNPYQMQKDGLLQKVLEQYNPANPFPPSALTTSSHHGCSAAARLLGIALGLGQAKAEGVDFPHSSHLLSSGEERKVETIAAILAPYTI